MTKAPMYCIQCDRERGIAIPANCPHVAASAGQAAYERDVAKWPAYHDGAPRLHWSELSEIARDSWNRNPTDR